MATHQDRFIYITGVVGRAMGSGKFGPDDIAVLTEAAYSAFKLTFGEPETTQIPQNPFKASPSQQSSPAPQRPQSAQSNGEAEPEAEGKPFRIWQGDKVSVGKKPGPGGKPWAEVTWAEAYRELRKGSASTRGYLEFIRDKIVPKGDRWDKANAEINARATALLIAAPEIERDNTPF